MHLLCRANLTFLCKRFKITVLVLNLQGGSMNIFEVDQKIAEKYPEMLAQMKEQAVSFAQNFSDSSEKLSDWGHKYFCPDDGEVLIFDLDKPHEHECKLCHKVHKSQELDNVWTFTYRNTAIVTLLELAVLYKVEQNPLYLEEYKKILSFYAEHYEEFPIHSKDKFVTIKKGEKVWDAGKIMPQGLNEAIIVIRISISLEILKNDLEQDFIDFIVQKLLVPACTGVLIPQVHMVHNKPCWADCAIGMVGLFAQNQELIDFAYNSELGFCQQMKQGVTADDFWFEGSIHYNYFLLEGVVQFLAFAKIYNKPTGFEDTVFNMLKQGYYYAFDNDIFPNPNDGWPDINLKTYDYSYALATKIFGEDSEIGNIYKHILANPADRVELPISKPYYFENKISFNHLVCTPFIDIDNRKPIKRVSKCYKSSYFAKIKNDRINVFLKYGHASASHSHPDKMNIEVMIDNKLLSRDISNTGYGVKICDEWNRKTLAHNTVVVDGLDHSSIVQGTILNFDDNNCHALAQNSYDGVDFERNISIFQDSFVDIFKIKSNENHNYDFVFHSQATLISEIDMTPANIGYSENGYQHLHDVKKVNCDDDSITLTWKLADLTLESIIDMKNSELFIAKSFDNPSSNFRTTLILRQKTDNADFNITWKIK